MISRDQSLSDRIVVLHLINSFEPGGAEQLLVDFYENLKDESVKLVLAYFKGKGTILPSMRKTSKIYDLSANGLFTVKSILKLARIVKQEHINIIHVHDAQSGLIGKLMSKITDIKKIIATRHTTYLQGNYPLLYWLENKTLKYYSLVIANSKAVKEYLVVNKFIDPEKCVVVPNGINVAKFLHDEPKMTSKEFIIGTVARLHRYKGVDILIEAFNDIQKKFTECKLLITGDGPEREHLETRVDSLQLRSKVKFIGSLNNQSIVKEFLPALDLFILPSRTEGFGIALVEAMVAGIPVIGSSTDGIKEIIDDGVNGLIFQNGNAQDLVRKIEFMIINEDARKKMAIRGSQDAKKKYSIESYCNSLVKLYKDI